MYNGPGKYLTQSNPYAQLLLRNSQQLNNGSHLGGVASALSQGLGGYQLSQDQKNREADREQQIAAQKAIAEGLRSYTQEGARPDGTADVQQPGSLSRVQQLLAGMADNPYAAEMSSSLAMQDLMFQRKQEAAKADRQAGIEDYRTKMGIKSEYEPKPKELMLFEAAQNDPEFAAYMRATGSQNTPATVQEWQFFSQLPNDQQAQYLTMKRANPYVDRGDARVLPNPAVPGENLAVMPKGIAPERTVTNGQVVTMPAVPGGPTQMGPQSFAPPQSMTPGMVTDDSPEQGGIAGQMPPQSGQGMPGQNFPMPGQPQVQDLPPTASEQRDAEKADLGMRQMRSKAETALSQLERKVSTVTDTIDKALSLAQTKEGEANPWATGYGSFLSVLPNTEAGELENYLTTIKANIGFDTLQQMRDNSPTGGALGQVSEMENRLLQAVNGALDPKQSGQLIENLKIIRETYPRVLAERKGAFAQDFGGQSPQSPSQSSGGFTVRKVK